MHWGALIARSPPRPFVGVISENVEEVTICRSRRPLDTIAILAVIFPKLTSLRAEYDDGPEDPLLQRPGPHDMRALSKLKNTLIALHLSTTPSMSWSFINMPPLLSPVLKDMHMLHSLTTECVWLFGRRDPSVALDLHSILPPNLVQVCLIDYWGVADRNSYYPAFPDNSPAVSFMERMLLNLSAQYSLLGTNMKSLHTISPCFDLSSTVADEIGGLFTTAISCYDFRSCLRSLIFPFCLVNQKILKHIRRDRGVAFHENSPH